MNTKSFSIHKAIHKTYKLGPLCRQNNNPLIVKGKKRKLKQYNVGTHEKTKAKREIINYECDTLTTNERATTTLITKISWTVCVCS